MAVMAGLSSTLIYASFYTGHDTRMLALLVWVSLHSYRFLAIWEEKKEEAKGGIFVCFVSLIFCLFVWLSAYSQNQQ